MTPSRRLQKDIRELSLKAIDGQLSDDERARFNSLVESDDDACRLLLQYTMLDADLIFHARSEAASVRAGSVERATPAAESRSSLARVAALLTLAAAVLVAAWLGTRPGPEHQEAHASPLRAERQPQPIASLTLAPGAVFQDRELAVGEAFLEGEELTLLEGEAHVSMSSGADFVLKSPGALRFVSAKHVRLLRGVMTAQVAEWGTGFTVDTETMRVIDLGTRFAIDASLGEVEAHVLQGQIRVQPLQTTVDGRRSVLLSKGEALRVDQKATNATRMTAAEDRFPESKDRFRPFKPIEMHNTGVNLAEGDEDPHWRIAAGPVGASYHGPQFGVVSVPHERYAPNEPKRSQWISFAKDLEQGANANSLFTFETEVDLSGFDLKTVMIAAQILADNGVRAIRINGEPVEMKPWDDNEFGQSFTRNRFRMVEIQNGFVPGVNKIEIDVWNGVYQFEAKKNDPNPMSLRVEFQAYGRLESSTATASNRKARPASLATTGRN
jgi:ferric-dicitrate binding protein FerR (iron transport regulator)